VNSLHTRTTACAVLILEKGHRLSSSWQLLGQVRSHTVLRTARIWP